MILCFVDGKRVVLSDPLPQDNKWHFLVVISK